MPNPDWTALGNFKCPNCPLDESEHHYCPVAVSIIDLIEFFRNFHSYDEVVVTVNSVTRDYSTRVSLQRGVSSILGLHMVTSGCPILGKLKPLVRYHLPFSTKDETSYRVISMYLVAQYFARKQGRIPDWDLKKLVEIYDQIQIVNKSFWNRLSHIKIEDASINALIVLDTFAQHVVFQIDEKGLSEIEFLCEKYFD